MAEKDTRVPNLIIISSGKGGTGKTTLCCSLADVLTLYDVQFNLIQIDDQDRLTRLYSDKVITIDIAAAGNSRRAPNAMIRDFDPVYAAVESSLSSGITTIVDVGATQQHALLRYAALTDLDEDLRELGVIGLWIAPCTAEPEAMAQAAKTIQSARKILPFVTPVLALNERDGIFEFYPSSPADRIWKTDLLPLCDELGSLTMRRIEAGSWQPFEAAGLRFVDVIGASIQQIQTWTGVSRPEAKVIRGDVSEWMADIMLSLSDLLSLDSGQGASAC